MSSGNYKQWRRFLLPVAVLLVIGVVVGYVFLLRWRVEFCSRCAVVRRVTYLDLLPGRWGRLTIHIGPAMSGAPPTLADVLSKYSAETPCVHDWGFLPGPSATSLSDRRIHATNLVGSTFREELLCGSHFITSGIDRIAEQDSELAFAIVRRVLAAPTEMDVEREYEVLLEVHSDVIVGANIDHWREAYGLPPSSLNGGAEPTQLQPSFPE